MEVVDFDSSHLGAVVELCAREGWPTLPADRARALRILTAPGSKAVVAVGDEGVMGFCQVLSDGEVQAYCSLLLVRPESRGRGLGRQLLFEAVRRAGGSRVDLLAEEGAVPFYRALPSREWVGFRVYPAG